MYRWIKGGISKMRFRIAALVVTGLVLSCIPAVFGQAASSGAIKRTPDGKPDFSGTWIGNGGGITDAVPVTGGGEEGVSSQAPKKSVYQGGNAPKVPTRSELAKQLPLTPKGQEMVAQYLKNDGKFGGETTAAGDPRYHNIPCGVVSPAELDARGESAGSNGDVEIVQNAKRLLIVYMGTEDKWIRMVWIGREHPKDLTDYEPVWLGHSVGKWEGDTLVVDTVRIKTEPGELISSREGAPQGPNFHMIERFHYGADGRLHVDKTFEDPDIYSHPWNRTVVFKKRTDWDEMADEWEIQDAHTVCEGGRYPSDNDVFIQGPPKN
jgi:hypothetical protein